ncbi:Sortilin [Dactylella cylindrospora]|nr:Sortilin [Dactylella cylindrospora]
MKAYILTISTIHYKTEDRGKTWEEWDSIELPSNNQIPLPAMNFHSGKDKSDHVILLVKVCEGGIDFEIGDCDEMAYYTKDNFKSKPKKLLENTHGCLFAHSSKQFDKATDDTVLCVVEGKNSFQTEKRRLYISENYFENGVVDAVEPKLDGQSTFQGISGIAVVQKFLIVAVKSAGTTEMALFVSNNAKDWARAEFPADHGKVEEDAYTILESMPSSLQVDVLTTKANNPIGSLFSSNSQGTQFTRILPNTNRNKYGLVDFESITNIEGIILANVVSNADELRRGSRGGIKKLQSKISFDNGRTWQDIKADKKTLHLHSVSDLSNLGRVFSSPAPGMVMGVGNTGEYLKDYMDGDLYVSEDAGLTWKFAKEGAHKYEFGDQGSIFVAVFDEDKTDEVIYSLDHGKTWDKVSLGMSIRARFLTTTPDSTSTKFTLVGASASREDKDPYYIFHLDFSDVRSRTCKKDDFQKWYARVDEKGDPDCLLGHKQFFWRRKSSADCFVNDLYKEEMPEFEVCACTEEDYECDINFERENGSPTAECIPKNADFNDNGKCTKETDKFKGPSGYRLIPGDNCDKDKGKKLDGEVDRDCGDIKKTPPSNGKITHYSKTFPGEMPMEQFYIERSDTSTGDDETVIIRTSTGEIWLSRDHGEKWVLPEDLKDKNIVAIYPNPYYHDRVYFLTASEEVIYTHDRAKTFSKFKAPGPPNGLNLDVINFHPLHPDYLIWTTHKDCPGTTDCHAVAYYTIDETSGWKPLLGYVRYCRWIANSYMDRKNLDKNMIFCERFIDDEPSKGKLELVISDQFFTKEEVKYQGIKGFATMEEFINVAVVDEEHSTLKVVASMDGKNFADTRFPKGFVIPHQHAYTVLESITHAVYLHVTVNDARGQEYGAILKSNSNGTDYVMSLPNVNRDESGYVDFERMQGLEGVALANIVINVEAVNNGAAKKYRSVITHNDGGQWSYIQAPQTDSEGHKFSCNVNNREECSLNLHGYTERADKRHTYSSASAVGLMLAVGNVGTELSPFKDGNTFLTRDGGINWVEVHKGAYMWEYGDQGSIIVVVKENQPTKSVLYTTDEGAKWNEYFFSEVKVNVFDISSVPSDTSRKFIIWAKENNAEKFSAVTIDFTGLTSKKCVLKPEDPDNDDFDYWTLSHPDEEDDCLFGHRVQYARKDPKKDCYIGARIPQPHSRFDNCTCTRHDFECAYNYELLNGGICQLVEGLQPEDPETGCAENPNQFEWFDPTPYRKIPLSTCSGGRELDRGDSHSCPGKQDKYNEKYGGIGPVGIFFLTLLSFGMAGVLGYILWNRWPGKLGAIRLGDDRREESPFIKYPIIVLSAIVAVVAAIPSIVGALYRIIANRFQRRPRYATRASFARGNYDHVTSDEGELLGEDSDEEV